ncbi:filamentous hemagglutinin N-terminal domain-containing protein [Nostoc sp. ChiVER01]|uniref:two-partner secretion domain-containing protein n=1 Tax=Nostoc sp. ChiVER01 TaxID=3075382 RepID=UPI002AD435A7|nr:filamentous hemagglutinin N-terminal domain-containing protein [Nostoc sp. ChiVER01]MDZ8226084.1 filamentous hemagglutinin N-terminal domain-containing protein [Nostoc sp. ChiVER01]
MSGITQDLRCWCTSLVMGGVLIASLQEHVFAQITPDSTLPNNSVVTLDGNTLNITGGTQAGSNLFHSFKEFSVPTGGTASFNNAVNIQNIISRVTGGSASNIDGLIRANGTANLFLINPNGIIFGQNARLDIGGSFLATTASSFKWSDGSTFSATNPQPPSELLAINPSALFFNQLQVARIENRSTTDAGNNLQGLRVPDGRSLVLVGGDIVLDGGSLNAAGGRVELAGVSGNGTVKLNVDSQNLSLSIPNGVPRADISLSNGALVDVRAGVGGSITVNAQNLELKGKSQIVAGIKSGLSTVTATAGDININATDTVSFDNSYARNNVEQTGVSKAGGIEITTGSLEVTNGAVLSASTFGKGDAGSVTITATDGIKFDGINSGAFSTVQPEAEGKAKGVAITTGSLAVTNGAVLSASTSGKGDAGSVNITATDSIKFDGWGSQAGSLVAPEAEGKAGGVTITTDSLAVTNGARLDASTFGKGDAGSINITATDSINFDGLGSGAFSSVESEAEGKAGGVTITTGSLAVTNNAFLDASTSGKGDAGSVNITATDSVNFDGFGSEARSRVNYGAEGKAGGVTITTGSLALTNGARLNASTSGKRDAGSVNITATDIVKFDGWGSGAFSTVAYGEGKAGGVTIITDSLAVTNGARLDTSTLGKGEAGSVNINATDSIKFDGLGSGAFSAVFSGEGKAGGVTITTGSLEVTDGASLSASTYGKGNAGSVNITATDSVKFDGSWSEAASVVAWGAEGKAGGVTITTGSLEVTNGAQLNASTSGKGDAGSVNITATDIVKFDGSGSGAKSRVFSQAEGKAGGVTITTGSLEVTNDAQLDASTSGKGDAGSVNITATNTIKFDGSGSEATSRVNYGAEGKAGGVTITTSSLELTNGAELSASTSGKGDAGSVNITATDSIKFDGSSNGAKSQVNPGAEGKAGNVSIYTGLLEVTNGAQISASTFGKGDAGSVNITATDGIKLEGSGSGAFSSVESEAEGKAGGVTITTDSLAVTNGAQLNASTFGKGDAGSVNITATDGINFDGSGSGASSSVQPEAEGKAGGVTITTGSLAVTNGAQINTSTYGKGDAGSVNITANTFEASNGGQVSTITSGQFQAGNIIFKVKDKITLSGSLTGLFAHTLEGSTGNGGSIFIDPRIMTIRDGAFIAVGSQGKGIGGDIHLTAGFLTLDGGTISARTRSSNGGNITLNLQDLLLLRNGSLISTTAGLEQFGGNGGDIIINTPNGFIVAVPRENSDITANAYTGIGGRVDIQAFGIYGIQPRSSPTSLSDITASSEFGINGTVELNTPDVDPNNGNINLPTIPVDTEVAQTCQAGGTFAKSSFTITGRGGLPPNPTTDILTPDLVHVDLVALKPSTREDKIPPVTINPTATPKPIVEATGWVINAKGELELTANAPTTPHGSWQNPVSCRSS